MFKTIKTIVLTVILIGTTVVAHSQKKITEGTITYDIAYKLTEEQKASMGGQQPPSEVKLEFNNGVTKIVISQDPIVFTIISNNNERTGLILYEMSSTQKRLAIKQSKTDVENALSAATKYSDLKATGEKQTIAGFKAEKYVYKDAKGTEFEIWATKDVQVPNVGSQDYFPGLAAFPVKFTLIQRGLETTTTLRSLVVGKGVTISEEVPTGYEIVLMSELMQKLTE